MKRVKTMFLARWQQRMGRTANATPDDAREAAKPPKAVKAAKTSGAAMRDELRARLLVHDPETQAVRHLYLVYKQLGIDGWAGAATLPRRVVHRAFAEAEMLQSQSPSPLLGLIVDRLRSIDAVTQVLAESEAAAEAAMTQREITASAAVAALPHMPEVSETSYDEYELMERGWIVTVPSALERSQPEP